MQIGNMAVCVFSCFHANHMPLLETTAAVALAAPAKPALLSCCSCCHAERIKALVLQVAEVHHAASQPNAPSNLQDSLEAALDALTVETLLAHTAADKQYMEVTRYAAKCSDMP